MPASGSAGPSTSSVSHSVSNSNSRADRYNSNSPLPTAAIFLGLSPSALSGAGAGLVSSIVTCPLDVVKTKLQAQGSIAEAAKKRAYHGLMGTLRRIYIDDGFRGFYRGLGPTIFGYLPTWAIYFTVYDDIKVVLSRDGYSQSSPEWLNHIIAAMSAGATGTIVTNPLWVVKTRFMIQSATGKGERYKHTLDAFRTIYRAEGVRGFYRGLLPSLLGVSHVAVQFPLYEQFKSWAHRYTPPDRTDLPPSYILVCSSLAKMIASVTTYPHEVLRTRLQIQRSHHAPSPPPPRPVQPLTGPMGTSSPLHAVAEKAKGAVDTIIPGRPPADSANMTAFAATRRYRGVLATGKKILAEEGLTGFYKGMGVNLLRTVPSSAITILTYEILMSRLSLSPPRDHSSTDDGRIPKSSFSTQNSSSSTQYPNPNSSPDQNRMHTRTVNGDNGDGSLYDELMRLGVYASEDVHRE